MNLERDSLTVMWSGRNSPAFICRVIVYLGIDSVGSHLHFVRYDVKVK